MNLCWRVFVLALVVVACQRTPTPELLGVSAVVPSEVQLGGSLKIVGEGFALGKPANVTLRGQLYRPGSLPEPLLLRLPAVTQAQSELVFSLPRQLQASLCGEPEVASHATFRGEVEVAIAARHPGTPPVTGTLRGAVLELYPAQKSEAAESSSLGKGRRMLDFLGLTASPVAAGMQVAGVAQGSRAERAGIVPGDRIVSAAGVSVLEPSDLVTAPARSIALVVARGHTEQALSVDVDGFAALPPRAVERAATLVGAFALVFLVVASPWAGLLRRLEHSVWELLLRRRERRQGHATLLGSRASQPLGVEAGLALIVVGAFLVAPLAGVTRVDPLEALLALWLLAKLGTSSLALVHGGQRPGRRWSLRHGTWLALCELTVTLPALVAFSLALFEPGLDLGRVLAQQGALPWQWRAFASPALLFSLAIVLLTALPEGRGPGQRLRSGVSRGSRPRARRDSLPGWLHLCALAGLASLVFLGGDRLPPLASEIFGDGRALRVVAAALVLLKTGALVTLVCLVRAAAYPLGAEQSARIALVTCLPLTLVLAALEQLWQHAGNSAASLRWLDLSFAPAALAALCLLVGVAGLRSALGWVRRQPPSPVSPWL
jgi:hypothetical protein